MCDTHVLHFPLSLQNGFYVARNDWKALHMPHVLLCNEVVKAFSDARMTKYRIQRPYQNSTTIWPEHELFEKYRPLRDDEVCKKCSGVRGEKRKSIQSSCMKSRKGGATWKEKPPHKETEKKT